MASSSNVIQWNCRGFRVNYNELKLLTQSFNPIVIALQETYLKEDVSFKHYEMYNTYGPIEDERAKGGVSELIKQGVIHSVLPLKIKLQAVAIRATLDKAITLCSIYIPPSSHLDIRDLENLVEQLPSPYMLMGDFNGHNPLWGCKDFNSKGRVLEHFVDNHALCFLNDGSATYLHPGNGSHSAIDLTLSSSDLITDFEWNVHDDFCGSDHFPIILTNGCNPLERVPQWNLKKADWGTFARRCLEHLASFPTSDHMNDPLTDFTNILITIADETIPKTSTAPFKPHLPWNTKECKEAIKARKKAARIFNRQPTAKNLSLFRINRAKARRRIKELRRTSWREFVSKLSSRTPMHKVWNMIQKLKGKHTKSNIKHLKNHNGDTLTTKHEIAEELASTFAQNSSSTNYTPEFQRFKMSKEKQHLNFSSNNTEEYNEPFTFDELHTALNKSHDTAVGPDQIHYQLLKHLPDPCLRTLLTLLNEVWDSGAIPSSWKAATVIPVPKPGKDHSLANNYRPIALTSCLSKTMERMVNDRLVYMLESNGLITDFQCGFRKNHSTTDHLVRLETFIRDAFAKKEHVCAVFFDLEKAYDTTWKYGILKDLHNMGFKGRLPEFILNFLADREFQVRVGSTLSDPHEQEIGVPQGSILSVTLFSIKINSIVGTAQKGITPSLYVDDYLICYRAKRMETIERQMQLSLNKLHTWSQQNGFTFSKSKTVCMHFCRLRNVHCDPELYLGGERIKVVQETRFLGVIFDSRLNFLAHIKALKNRCLKALDVIKAVSSRDWGADCSVLQLYRSLIRSKLDYGCIVYGSAPISYLKQLNTIHHQGLRLCLGAYRTSPAESLYVAADEPSLEHRRIKLSLQYATKLFANPSNPAFNSVFNHCYAELYNKNPKAIKPLALRIQPHLEAAELDLKCISKTTISEMAPWKLHKPTVCFDLTEYSKADTDPIIFQSEFLDLRARYPNHISLYTDGSKKGTSVSSAVICKKYEVSARIPDKASVYTAEINAILLALDIITASNRKKFIIFSDSLSVLQALDSGKTDHPFLLKAITQLTELHQNQYNIVFCWVPSHMGLSGNDRADLVAKQALTLPITETPIPYSDLRQYISQYIRQLWQDSWSVCTSNKLYAIQPELGYWHTSDLPRKDQIIFNRCRIGHSRLTHSWLLKGDPIPECVFCACPLTIKHLLLDCSDLAIVRQQVFNVTFFGSLEEIFSQPASLITAFIKEAGLLHKL